MEMNINALNLISGAPRSRELSKKHEIQLRTLSKCKLKLLSRLRNVKSFLKLMIKLKSNCKLELLSNCKQELMSNSKPKLLSKLKQLKSDRCAHYYINYYIKLIKFSELWDCFSCRNINLQSFLLFYSSLSSCIVACTREMFSIDTFHGLQ